MLCEKGHQSTCKKVSTQSAQADLSKLLAMGLFSACQSTSMTHDSVSCNLYSLVFIYP